MLGDNLVMQVPCLKVSVCAFPAKQGAVVNLYQLPVGVVTKVSEESKRTETLRVKIRQLCAIYFFNPKKKGKKKSNKRKYSILVILYIIRSVNTNVLLLVNGSKYKVITDM